MIELTDKDLKPLQADLNQLRKDLDQAKRDHESLKKFSLLRAGLDPSTQMGINSAISVWPQSKVVRPQVIVHLSANQVIPNNATTAISWDTDDYNPTAGMHVIGINPTRLTIPVDAVFLIVGHIQFDASAVGVIRNVDVLLNGATQLANFSIAPLAAPYFTIIEVTSVRFLAKFDYVEIRAVQDSGGNLNAIGKVFNGGAPPCWASVTQLL